MARLTRETLKYMAAIKDNGNLSNTQLVQIAQGLQDVSNILSHLSEDSGEGLFAALSILAKITRVDYPGVDDIQKAVTNIQQQVRDTVEKCTALMQDLPPA